MADRYIADRYRLVRRISPGHAGRGVPELWRAEDAGDVYYVKLWRKVGGDGAEIQALWNREVRGLSRLQGYPGASNLFVRLHDLRSDNAGYYAILDGGHRLPLSAVLEARASHPWLRNLAETGRRRPVWEGLLRVAEALSLLHREGTLHRNLAPDSIFVDPAAPSEFRLSGFEWSLRVAVQSAAVVGGARRLRAPELDRGRADYGVGTDWFDFGLLAAAVFGLLTPQVKTRDALRATVGHAPIFRDRERRLLLQLLEEDVDQRLASADAAVQQVRNIVLELTTVAAAPGRPLALALRLGSNVGLVNAVARASGSAVGADLSSQLEWIRHDLRGDVRITGRLRPSPYYVLHGERLEYKVRPWTADNSRATWDVAYCDAVESAPRFVTGDQYFGLGSRRLDVQLYPHVRGHFQAVRDKSSPWDKAFPFAEPRQELEPHLRDVHDFFRVSQQLDTLLIAAQICPVEVISVEHDSLETQVTVTPLEEPDRNDLAQHLGLPRPSEQLAQRFRLGVEPVADDDEDAEGRYQLLERRTLDRDSAAPADWRFRGARAHPQGARYLFTRDGASPLREGRAYLARNHGGIMKQVRRRHRAIEELRNYEGLLRLLADPAGVARDTGESLPSVKREVKVDGPKADALAALWRQQPSYAVQGPPGSGKTTLINAFVAKLLGSDSSAQILISAHSHHTVDDVRRKLARWFNEEAEAKRPLIVRLGARKVTEYSSEVVARALAVRLAASPLAARARGGLRRRLEDMLAEESRAPLVAAAEMRTLQILVQNAANITLATSNSADLAELSERGRRFDWSLIEEAGKAHGFDMTAALQASHRLLLIGDHYQLSPFDAKRFRDLLGDAARIRNAVRAGVTFAPRLVDQSVVEDADDREPLQARCQRWRTFVDFFGAFFERSLANGSTEGAAATLTDQHRMHPHIADIVAQVFYNDPDRGLLLRSPPSTEERFEADPPYVIVKDSWLPDERVVWVDTPWVQRKEWAEGEVEGLLASDAEARLVVDVLDQLRPAGDEACDVQVLSPYNDQLRLIRTRISEARGAGRLGTMFQPPFDLQLEKRQGATVDEFQGSEADVVVVSLVRNNGLVPWVSLGFLKEPNRMNVLLSRARHKLVIVGCREFFDTRVDAKTFEAAEYAWLGRLMSTLRTAEKAGRLGYVPSK